MIEQVSFLAFLKTGRLITVGGKSFQTCTAAMPKALSLTIFSFVWGTASFLVDETRHLRATIHGPMKSISETSQSKICEHTCESVVPRCPDAAGDQSGEQLATSF